ncbi:large ribosomal subunit protein uL30y [Physcomitrium patens]|uniref:Ribosomal protein L30 ferredoxin-like fold domain-containing protein n=1 Tax=Physcomitrium patens TaxID=3218 RepID=A0A2K1JUL6_PHYPA|nr:60S ribosomal protein L7-2-like [Physcomitrium patens]PNR45220.1 hypothetical protein PHYPA_014991 [Physcomitrium patens]|eukprot:XP_024389764.1 60S ribosomal protein L7-2-like [Physcomitrella patens]
MADMEVEKSSTVDAAPAAGTPMKTVPETLLKKRKRDEQWAINRKQLLESGKNKNSQSRKVIFKRAEQFIREYRGQEADFIRLKKELKVKSRSNVLPEGKLMFIIRIRGVNNMHPKTRKTMQLLRLKQTFDGVFLKVNESTMSLLRRVEPYVIYGNPNLKSVRELIYKRGYGNVNKSRTALTDNTIIEKALGQFGIICIEDLVHEIYSVGPHFKEANSFLLPFKLSCPLGGLKKKQHYAESGDAGSRDDLLNRFLSQMN